MPELPFDTCDCSRFDLGFENCHYKLQGFFFKVILLSARLLLLGMETEQDQCPSLIKTCLLDFEGWEGNGPKVVENGLGLV